MVSLCVRRTWVRLTWLWDKRNIPLQQRCNADLPRPVSACHRRDASAAIAGPIGEADVSESTAPAPIRVERTRSGRRSRHGRYVHARPHRRGRGRLRGTAGCVRRAIRAAGAVTGAVTGRGEVPLCREVRTLPGPSAPRYAYGACFEFLNPVKGAVSEGVAHLNLPLPGTSVLDLWGNHQAPVVQHRPFAPLSSPAKHSAQSGPSSRGRLARFRLSGRGRQVGRGDGRGVGRRSQLLGPMNSSRRATPALR